MCVLSYVRTNTHTLADVCLCMCVFAYVCFFQGRRVFSLHICEITQLNEYACVSVVVYVCEFTCANMFVLACVWCVLCTCVCVCVLCMCVSMRDYICMSCVLDDIRACVCILVYERERERERVCVCVYIYICVGVCMRVCVALIS